jgi:hypothetical protein
MGARDVRLAELFGMSPLADSRGPTAPPTDPKPDCKPSSFQITFEPGQAADSEVETWHATIKAKYCCKPGSNCDFSKRGAKDGETSYFVSLQNNTGVPTSRSAADCFAGQSLLLVNPLSWSRDGDCRCGHE